MQTCQVQRTMANSSLGFGSSHNQLVGHAKYGRTGHKAVSDRLHTRQACVLEVDSQTEVHLSVSEKMRSDGNRILYAVCYKKHQPSCSLRWDSTWEKSFYPTLEMDVLLDSVGPNPGALAVLFYQHAILPAMDDPEHWVRTLSQPFWEDMEQAELDRRDMLLERVHEE